VWKSVQRRRREFFYHTLELKPLDKILSYQKLIGRFF
jgi:hypothetical protein